MGQYDNIPHIFSWMDPMPGAIESFKALQEKYDVIYPNYCTLEKRNSITR